MLNRRHPFWTSGGASAPGGGGTVDAVARTGVADLKGRTPVGDATTVVGVGEWTMASDTLIRFQNTTAGPITLNTGTTHAALTAKNLIEASVPSSDHVYNRLQDAPNPATIEVGTLVTVVDDGALTGQHLALGAPKGSMAVYYRLQS